MTEEEKQMIMNRIEKQLNDIQFKIKSMEEMTQPVSPENSIGRLSRMDAINNKSVMEAALRTARKEYEELLWARKNICEIDYGKCTVCHKLIQIKRLMLMPGTRYCVRCK